MPPVLAYAPAPEVDLLAAYDEHCDRLGLDQCEPSLGRANVPAALARSAAVGR